MVRSPNACRCPRASAVSAAAASAADASRAGTYPRTTAGLAGSMRAPRPSSTSSNAGSTVVPPLATRPRISLTASTASRSTSTESSSQAPASAERVTDLVEEPAVLATDQLAALGRVRLEQLALLLRELRRDGDVDHHVEVAARPGAAQVGHA